MTNSTQVALILTATDKATAIVNSMTNNAGKKLSGIVSFGKKLGDIGPKMMVVGDEITGFFKDTIKDAQNADKQYRLLERTLLNVGDKIGKNGKGVVAEQFAKYADDLELKIGQEGESIMQVQSKLAVFRSVISKQSRDNGTFNKSVMAAFDLQAAGLGDATTEARKLGMALEDPTNNLKKFAKGASLVFTETEKTRIQLLQQSGRKAEAQQIILDKVNSKYKGMAERSADPLLKMNMGIDNVKKKIGAALLPTVQQFSDSMNNGLISKMMDFVEKNPAVIKSIAGVGVALLVIGKTMTLVTTLMSASPLGLIVAGIAIAATLIIANWDKIGPFFSRLWKKVTDFFSYGWQAIKYIFIRYSPQYLIFKNWDKITAFFSGLWSGIKSGVKAGWELIKNIFFDYTPAGIIFNHWSGITDFFTNLWGNVKGIFKGWIDWVFGLGGKMFEAGGNIVTSIWNGIKNKAQILIDGVKGVAQKVRDFFPFSPAKTGPLRDIHKIKLIETIAQSVNASPLIKSMTAVTSKVLSFQPKIPEMAYATRAMPAIPQNYQRSSGMPSITYAPVFHLSGSATEQDAKRVSAVTAKDFEKLMREYEAKKRRTSIE